MAKLRLGLCSLTAQTTHSAQNCLPQRLEQSQVTNGVPVAIGLGKGSFEDKATALVLLQAGLK